jgi:hypothetical protein
MKRLAGGRLRIGAVKYAVEHLGHDSSLFSDMNACSAVTVAIDRGSAPGDINSLVRDINPLWPRAKGKRVTRWPTLFMKMTLRSQRRFESRPNSASSPLRFG